jgi:hypothetical protein
MNTSTIYDRELFKNDFLKIYNKNKYSFGINSNLIVI